MFARKASLRALVSVTHWYEQLCLPQVSAVNDFARNYWVLTSNQDSLIKSGPLDVPRIMITPSASECGASVFVRSPVPVRSWEFSHPGPEQWSPLKLLHSLNRHALVHDEAKPLPGGPHGLPPITLTLLRITMLTTQSDQNLPFTQLDHIAF